MAHSVKVLPQFELTILGYSGRLSAADFDGVWNALATNKESRVEFDDIAVLAPDADYSDVAYEISMAQAERYVRAHRPPNLCVPKRSAFLCANEMQATMARMFAAFVQVSGCTNVQILAFTSLQSTIAWFEREKSGRPIIDMKLVRAMLIEMGHGWCARSIAA